MGNNESDIKDRLYKEMCLLSDDILNQKGPFKDIPKPAQIMPFYYRKYLQHKEKVGKDFSEKIYQALIESAHHSLKSIIFGFKNVESFSEVFPNHMNVLDEFKKWIWREEDLTDDKFIIKDPLPFDLKLKPDKVIKSVFCQEFREFHYWSKKSSSSVLFFYKDRPEQKLLIIFDTGGHIQAMGASIGFDKLDFWVDLTMMLGAGGSRFKYHNEETLTSQLYVAFDYLRFILPHFEALMDRVFSNQ